MTIQEALLHCDADCISDTSTTLSKQTLPNRRSAATLRSFLPFGGCAATSSVVSRPMQARAIAGVIAIAAIERKERNGRRNGMATRRPSLSGQRVWTTRRRTRALRRRKKGFCVGLHARVSEEVDGRSVATINVTRRNGSGSNNARRRRRAQRG